MVDLYWPQIVNFIPPIARHNKWSHHLTMRRVQGDVPTQRSRPKGDTHWVHKGTTFRSMVQVIRTCGSLFETTSDHMERPRTEVVEIFHIKSSANGGQRLDLLWCGDVEQTPGPQPPPPRCCMAVGEKVSLLSCGDVEDNQGLSLPLVGWGRTLTRGMPYTGPSRTASSRDILATQANPRFAVLWARADIAFSKP